MNEEREKHRKLFSEFLLYETVSGGPDPQIPLVAEICRLDHADWMERLWRAGCYIAVYNVPFAEVLWQEWPLQRMINERRSLPSWLTVNFHRIVTRTERKTVRRPEWMNEYLQSYYRFMMDILPVLIYDSASMNAKERYLLFWDESIREIKRYARYVALKLLESYRLYCAIPLEAPDIRPKDGWSPMKTMSWLFPEHRELLLSGDNTKLEDVNMLVEELQNILKETYHVETDLFHLQVALCEYRESYEGRRQYPGRSHDSELGYYHKAQARWEYNSRFLEARSNIFPKRHLGELCGWEGARNILGTVVSDYGYTWTDLLYDYVNTLSFAQPVEW